MKKILRNNKQMNISITLITNGWIVSVQSPKGAMAIHCKDWAAVMTQLAEIGQEPSNVTPMEQNPPTRN